jgi:glycosyltransferase involved in cell wall biosynthesis
VRWLVFGTYDVYSHPRVAVLIEGLRAGGETVDEVNVPLKLNTAGRVAMLRQPWRLPLLAFKLARCWLLLVLRARKAARAARPDVVLVGYLGHFDVRLARLLFRRTPIVLDHLVSAAGTARDRGLDSGGGLKSKLLIAIDDGALKRADVVVVDTPEHREALPSPARNRAVVVPVGATAEWFALGRRVLDDATERADGPLRAIFVGVFTPLHGTVTLGEALAALASDEGVEVTMVGTGQDYAACKEAAAANPRVTWIDWVPGDELPVLVADHDVSLGIFGTTTKARNVVPTKVYQGAAAGCAVVTSDTEPQRAAMAEAAVYVPPGDADALAAAIRRLAEDRAELSRLRVAAATLAAKRFIPSAAVEPMRTATADQVTRDVRITNR